MSIPADGDLRKRRRDWEFLERLLAISRDNTRRPGLKVLFTTGYTRNAVVHGGVLDAGVHFIAKPFTLDQIGVKLREVLAAG